MHATRRAANTFTTYRLGREEKPRSLGKREGFCAASSIPTPPPKQYINICPKPRDAPKHFLTSRGEPHPLAPPEPPPMCPGPPRHGGRAGRNAPTAASAQVFQVVFWGGAGGNAPPPAAGGETNRMVKRPSEIKKKLINTKASHEKLKKKLNDFLKKTKK